MAGSLFRTASGAPMSFTMPLAAQDGASERQRLKDAVEKHGGYLLTPLQAGTGVIHLRRADFVPPPGSVIPGPQVYLATYVDDCIKENKLLDLEVYKIAPSELPPKRTYAAYTEEEDKSIIEFVEEQRGKGWPNGNWKGDRLWEKAAKQLPDVKHSAQSMKERFKKHLQQRLSKEAKRAKRGGPSTSNSQAKESRAEEALPTAPNAAEAGTPAKEAPTAQLEGPSQPFTQAPGLLSEPPADADAPQLPLPTLYCSIPSEQAEQPAPSDYEPEPQGAKVSGPPAEPTAEAAPEAAQAPASPTRKKQSMASPVSPNRPLRSGLRSQGRLVVTAKATEEVRLKVQTVESSSQAQAAKEPELGVLETAPAASDASSLLGKRKEAGSARDTRQGRSKVPEPEPAHEGEQAEQTSGQVGGAEKAARRESTAPAAAAEPAGEGTLGVPAGTLPAKKGARTANGGDEETPAGADEAVDAKKGISEEREAEIKRWVAEWERQTGASQKAVLQALFAVSGDLHAAKRWLLDQREGRTDQLWQTWTSAEDERILACLKEKGDSSELEDVRRIHGDLALKERIAFLS